MRHEIAAKIKSLKPPKGFTVKGDSAREEILRTANALKVLNQIDFDVVTKRVGETDSFRVFAACKA